MAFCANCGSQLEPDARFCSVCGTGVEAGPEHAQSESLSADPASADLERATGPPSQPSTLQRLIVPALILVVVAAIAGYALSQNNAEGDQADGIDAEVAADRESPSTVDGGDPALVASCQMIADLHLEALQDVLDALGPMTVDELQALETNSATGKVPDALDQYEAISSDLDARAEQTNCTQQSLVLVCEGLEELNTFGEAGLTIVSTASTSCASEVAESNGTDGPEASTDDGTSTPLDFFTQEAVAALITGPDGQALVAPAELGTLFAWADNAVPFQACDTASPGDAEANQFVTDTEPRQWVTRVTWFPSVLEAAAYFDYLRTLEGCIEHDGLFATELESEEFDDLLVVTSTSVFLRDPTESEGWAGQQGDVLTAGPITYGRRANLIISAFLDGPVPIDDVLSLFE